MFRGVRFLDDVKGFRLPEGRLVKYYPLNYCGFSLGYGMN